MSTTARTRNRETPRPSHRYLVTRSGSTIEDSSPEWFKSPFKETMTDYVVPNWRRRVLAGEIITNPFNSVKEYYHVEGQYHGEGKYSSNPEVWQTHIGSNGYFLDSRGRGTWYSSTPQFSQTPIIEQAQIQCLANVNKTEFDSITFMGEWEKTRNLHRAVAKSAFDVVQATYADIPGVRVTRGALRLKLGKLKAYANTYLLVRYGLLPLMHDLRSACAFLQRERPIRETARGYANHVETLSSVHESHDGQLNWVIQSECRREISVRAGLLYDATPATKILGAAGLLDPLSSAWELTKLSFVFDWLIDVGSWLDAIQPSGATKVLTSYYSVVETVTHTSVIAGSKKNPPSIWDSTQRAMSNSGSRLDMAVGKRRVIWNGSVPPLPAAGSGLNALRSLDLAMLIAQRVGHVRKT